MAQQTGFTVPVGLQDIYYAVLTKDDATGVTYSAPKKLSAAITANVTPSVESATLFGDDAPIVTANALGSITVEIGIADIPFADYVTLLGAKVDAKGMLIDNADDQAPEVALGFRRSMSDGSFVYTWLLKGKFALPNEEATTKQGSVTFQTPTMTGTFLKRQYDGNWRFRAHSTDAKSAELIKTWFTAATINAAPTPTPTTSG